MSDSIIELLEPKIVDNGTLSIDSIYDYFFPDLESGECHPYISATFFIRCKMHCVEFRRHFDFKFKDNDDFSDYIGPVELVKEWNGE